MDDPVTTATAHAMATAPTGGDAGRAGFPAPRSPVLLRLEQLASEELLGALPLAVGAEHTPDVLLACIHWDLDSSSAV